MLNPKVFRLYSVLLSIILLVISLTQQALVVKGSNDNSALGYFIGGAISIIGGGTFEWIIWWANPLCLISIILFFMNKRNAVIFSFIALLLSLSFLAWNEILISESGTTGKILYLESGYYLWLSSIIVLTFSTCFYFIKYKSPINFK